MGCTICQAQMLISAMAGQPSRGLQRVLVEATGKVQETLKVGLRQVLVQTAKEKAEASSLALHWLFASTPQTPPFSQLPA